MNMNEKKDEILCQICKLPKKPNEVVPAGIVHEPLIKMIQEKFPNWSSDGFICKNDLNHFRSQYVRNILENDKGEISTLEEQVVKSLKEQELLSKNINVEYDQKSTLAERLSDRLAEIAGSWLFILSFAFILFLWIAINAFILVVRPFDPYPFILLNLVLSCMAAIQAPIILMSQNRQESKDRLRAEHDYLVNLKAELEIRHLHEKIDHLLMHQWQRLLEIQQIQTELMEELSKKA